MLRVRAGDRVQVREGRDEGYALTGLRTPPGTVKDVKGTGTDARIVVELDGGQVMAFKPGELELLGVAPSRGGGVWSEDNFSL